MDNNFEKPQGDTNNSNLPETEADKSPENVDIDQNDEFVIGKGFVVDDSFEPDYDNGKRKSKKSGKGIIKSLIWIFCIILISVGIAFGVIFAGADYLGIGFGRGENVVIEISPGTPTSEIGEILKESGAVKVPILFRIYSKFKKYDSLYKYGVYSFNNESGYEALAQMLMTEGAEAQSVKVTIPEMSSIDDITKLLVESNVCTKADFIDAVQNGSFDYDFVKQIPTETVYYRLEGYLFPDTYDFYNYESKECAYLAVDKMLKNLDKKITNDMWEKIESSEYNFHQIMTMASVVELESGGAPDEMANVAAVFFNRLKSPDFGTLGSSPTIKYPYGNGRYDTYKVKGLPPGPLCSPSIASIKGSISPTTDFDYYYFVTDAKMKFYYNKTLNQHNAIIAKLKKENNWIYEYIN